MNQKKRNTENSAIKNAAKWWITPRDNPWPIKKRLRGVAIIGIIVTVFLVGMSLLFMFPPSNPNAVVLRGYDVALLSASCLCFIPSVLALIFAALSKPKSTIILRIICLGISIPCFLAVLFLYLTGERNLAPIPLFPAVISLGIALLARGAEDTQ